MTYNPTGRTKVALDYLANCPGRVAIYADIAAAAGLGGKSNVFSCFAAATKHGLVEKVKLPMGLGYRYIADADHIEEATREPARPVAVIDHPITGWGLQSRPMACPEDHSTSFFRSPT